MFAYQEFKHQLLDLASQKIKEQGYKGLTILNHPIMKNNDITLDGLTLEYPEQALCPTFYVEQLFKQYQQGLSMDRLVDHMLCSWQEAGQETMDTTQWLDYDQCRSRIIYRLINTRKNEKMLEGMPGIPFLDLTIVFLYYVGEKDDGIMNMPITNSLMELWGCTPMELLEDAHKNTWKLMQIRLETIVDRLCELLPEELEDAREALEINVPSSVIPYIMTNNCGVNGAASLLYPGSLCLAALELGESYYILPSSIHELILVPESEVYTVDHLQEMVREVSDQCLDDRDFLSDHIYFYDQHQKTLQNITHVPEIAPLQIGKLPI